MRKICANCKNIIETEYLINDSQVYMCSLMKTEASLESTCDRFLARKIEPYKRPIPPMNDPSTEWFRGFNDYGITHIKTRKGEIIRIWTHWELDH